MSRAAIDLGSNSCLLLVESDAGEVVLDQGLVVGLGRGLGDGGTLAADRMHRAVEVLSTYAARAQFHGVAPEDVVCIATSAARRATNAEDFFGRLQAATGLRFSIVEGKVEARLSWRGAVDTDLFSANQRVAMLDIGGGSTELAWGTAGAPEPHGRISLEVGTVRLTEELFGMGTHDASKLPEAIELIDTALKAVPRFPVENIVGVAGTAVTLAGMLVTPASERLDPDRLHGTLLPVSFLEQMRERMMPMSPEERRALVVPAPDRADTLIAGTLIAERLLHHLRRPHLLVSARDLRHGALAARASGELDAAPDRTSS